ncbi:MAG: type Z 30S ribosomal protein S14 [Candidatus Nealsonbacteria bacterium]
MATKAKIVKSKKKPKFSSRIVRRCFRCGRKRGYMRKFGLCRICFREMANQGLIPGVKKSSW